MTQTVREFVNDAYSLVSSGSPTQPLHGNDQKKAIRLFNDLMAQYAANGFLITINHEVTKALTTGTQTVSFGATGSGADIEKGYLSYLTTAWVVLADVTYPLTQVDRNIFDASYKFDPLDGLPRFAVLDYNANTTDFRIYPAPSQAYTLHVKGKFSFQQVDSNDNMNIFPFYQQRFYKLALARDIAFYKGRQEAWTPKLENMYKEAFNEMDAATPVNTELFSDREALLNGANRVRAGI